MTKFKAVLHILFKSLLCFILAFAFLFAPVFPQKTEAAGTAARLSWQYVIKPFLVGYALDKANEMGIRWTSEAEAKGKAAQVVEAIKPYYKDGYVDWVIDGTEEVAKLTMSNPAMGFLIATQWGKLVETTAQKAKKDDDDYLKLFPIEGDDTIYIKRHPASWSTLPYDVVNPFYNTNIMMSVAPRDGGVLNARAVDYFTKMINYKITPVPFYQRSKIEMYDKLSSRLIETFYVQGNEPFYLLSETNQSSTSYTYRFASAYNFTIDDNVYSPVYKSETSNSKDYEYGGSNTSTANNFFNVATNNYRESIEFYNAYLIALAEANSTYYIADGMIISNQQKYVQLQALTDGQNYSIDNMIKIMDNLGIPSTPYVKSIPIPPGFEVTDDEENQDVLLQIIEKQITIPSDKIPKINPVYVITPEQQDSINKQIIINIGGGGTGGEVGLLDGTLLAYIRNSYTFATDTLNTGVNGLNTMLAGSAGLIGLYGTFFSFLPGEFSIMIGSMITIAVGLWVIKK